MTEQLDETQAACADPTTVKPQCATIGIGEEHGMWAGLTPDERHTIRKRTGTPVNPPARQWLPQIGA